MGNGGGHAIPIVRGQARQVALDHAGANFNRVAHVVSSITLRSRSRGRGQPGPDRPRYSSMTTTPRRPTPDHCIRQLAGSAHSSAKSSTVRPRIDTHPRIHRHAAIAGIASRPPRCGLGQYQHPTPSWHRLGPGDMSFEAKRFRHVAVAIPIVAIGSVVALGRG